MSANKQITLDVKLFLHNLALAKNERDIEYCIYNLFVTDLGWKTDAIKRQLKIEPTDKPDILLFVSDKITIPIEVKMPYEFSNKKKHNEWLLQLIRYLTKLDQKFGILTDGKRWLCIDLNYDHSSAQRIHYFDLNKKEQRNRSMLTLSLFTPNEIYSLFCAMASIHANFDEKQFDAVMNLERNSRIRELLIRHDDSCDKYHAGLKKLITDIYSGGISPLRYMYKLDMCKPIRVLSSRHSGGKL